MAERPKITAICDGIATFWTDNISGLISRSYDEFLESEPDPPAVTVYPELADITEPTGQITFQGNAKILTLSMRSDFLVTKRNNIMENMEASVKMWDSIIDAIDTIAKGDTFATNTKAVGDWSLAPVLFTYNNNTLYMDVRVTFSVELYF